MNKEIKEILDRIETASEIFDCLLKPEECTELLDYITNLQQENERLKEENLDLAKENEEEKQFIKDCGFQNQQQLALMYLDYKSRCEKAIEYIKQQNVYYGFCDNLLNILQNGSDSQ